MPDLLKQHGSMAALIEASQQGERTLKRYIPPELDALRETLAGSALLDPETPQAMFEPFADGGLFRKGSRLGRIRARLRRNKKQ